MTSKREGRESLRDDARPICKPTFEQQQPSTLANPHATFLILRSTKCLLAYCLWRCFISPGMMKRRWRAVAAAEERRVVA